MKGGKFKAGLSDSNLDQAIKQGPASTDNQEGWEHSEVIDILPGMHELHVQTPEWKEEEKYSFKDRGKKGTVRKAM